MMLNKSAARAAPRLKRAAGQQPRQGSASACSFAQLFQDIYAYLTRAATLNPCRLVCILILPLTNRAGGAIVGWAFVRTSGRHPHHAASCDAGSDWSAPEHQVPANHHRPDVCWTDAGFMISI